MREALLERFISSVSSKLTRVSHERRQKTIDNLREKYEEDTIFADHDKLEDDWIFDDPQEDERSIIDLMKEEPSPETELSEGEKMLISYIAKLLNDEDEFKIDNTMSVEERVLILQKKYEKEHLFDDDEMIPSQLNEIDLQGHMGMTKMHDAVVKDNEAALIDLLENKADHHIKDNGKLTPYALATARGRKNLIEIFHRFGISE